MGENITNDNGAGTAVKLTSAQNRILIHAPIAGSDNREAGSPERGTYMPSQDDIAGRMLEVLSKLNPENLELALRFAEQEATQSIQGSESASPAIIGERYP